MSLFRALPRRPAAAKRDRSNLNLEQTIMKTSEETKHSWLWLVLLIPYIALLWLPFYNDTRPSFAGFPFFYWYQFLWVPLTSLIIYIVYRGVK
ncbi:hypothetical protein AWB69_04232 [Caballeronia udeis]|uniref:DUF3311 domain-containing protein n=2 Tax=Caballeronia udeis TaxID=1232866 RepID=A0A158HBZ6_9BURK|nr:hypothetical protein AWB69_04232 [Caballeronia udeis]